MVRLIAFVIIHRLVVPFGRTNVAAHTTALEFAPESTPALNFPALSLLLSKVSTRTCTFDLTRTVFAVKFLVICFHFLS